MTDQKNMRYASVDILRGLTVAVMILVNNPGSWHHVHPWLLHAEWFGCQMADLVFPFFLFIVGLSIVFSLSKALNAGADKKQLAVKCLKRSLILILLGLILNIFPDFDFAHLRFPGVLQRIALVFAISSLLFIYCSETQRRWIAAFVLIGYWLLLCFVPVPGTGMISLEKNQNWVSWIDQLVLNGHMWKYSVTWDPEGLLGTLPAVVTSLLGISAAVYMKRSPKPVRGLLLCGLAAVTAGIVWSFFFPMNKALWTSSFVLFTTGIALLCLCVAIYFFDERQQKQGTLPFMALGANTLAIYFGSEFLARVLIYIEIHNITLTEHLFAAFSFFLSPVVASFVMALTMVCFWTGIAILLYRNKVFLKI